MKRTRCSSPPEGPGFTPIRPLKVFISSNELENQDINHPEWENWKVLKTDQERYEAVQKIWRNFDIPSTRTNLGAFNWRKRNNLPPVKIPYFKSPPHYSHIQEGTLDDFFLWRKNENYKTYKLKQNDIRISTQLDMLKEDELLNRNLQFQGFYASDVYYYRKHQEAVGRVKKEYQRRMHAEEQAWNRTNSRLDAASKEIRTVAKFYSGLHEKNSLKLSKIEMTAWMQREDVLNQYSDFYEIPSRADCNPN